MNMKQNKKLWIGIGLICTNYLYAQQAPTNTSPGTATNGTTSNQFWSRAGNTDINGTNNIFGTLWNSPIYFSTNNTNRMALMGNNPAGSFTGAFGLGTTLPLSYMHLTNLTNIGSHFRTDGPDFFRSQWEFFTGPTAGNTTRKFRVFTTQTGPLDNGTLQNNQHITLEASQRDMIFNAGGDVERMRILGQNHILPVGGIWGSAIPLAGNVGIGNPHPLSMLHIGGNASSNAGWRIWMKTGTLYACQGGLDNMYVGLKEIQNDQTEAIINWGNNPSSSPTNADRLRFVFTAASGNGSASGVDGLQIAHMWANNVGDGRMAIGDFQTPNLDPQNTLEIRPSSGSPYWGSAGGTSGLRFSFMTALNTPVTNPGSGVLAVDEFGDVIYVTEATGGGSGGGFVACADSTGAANLLTDSKVNLNDFNLYFENNNVLGQNHAGFGYTCGNVLPAKLSVHQIHPATVNTNTFAISGINSDTANQVVLNYSGVYGKANGLQVPALRITNIGGDFEATGGAHNYGVRTKADNLSGGSVTQGVNARSDGGSISTGVNATAINGSFLSVGGDFAGVNSPNLNYGVRATAGGGALNYGIYANSGPAPTDRAGYFVGIAESTSTGILSSDQMFKTDVQEIQNPMETLNQLAPKDYFLDTINFGQMNFTSNKQFGFIAQEVETILPNLVYDSHFPDEYDSIGNLINPGFSYKSMNYTGIIPLNTAAIKQLDREFQNQTLSDQTIKTNVVDLSNSLSKVLAMRGVS